MAIVIDGRGQLLGRLASVIAKELLNGTHIHLVRAEEINISGSRKQHATPPTRSSNASRLVYTSEGGTSGGVCVRCSTAHTHHLPVVFFTVCVPCAASHSLRVSCVCARG